MIGSGLELQMKRWLSSEADVIDTCVRLLTSTKTRSQLLDAEIVEALSKVSTNLRNPFFEETSR